MTKSLNFKSFFGLFFTLSGLNPFLIIISISFVFLIPNLESLIIDKTNIVKTEINVKIFLRYCGTSCFRNKSPISQPEIKPIKKPIAPTLFVRKAF